MIFVVVEMIAKAMFSHTRLVILDKVFFLLPTFIFEPHRNKTQQILNYELAPQIILND